MTDRKAGVLEVSLLFINLICNKFFLFAPEYFRVVSQSGTALMIAVMFIFMFAVWFFYNKVNFSRKSFGKISGSILVIIYTISLALTLRQYTETVKVISLTDSSLYFVEAIFVTAMIFGALSGFRALCKAHVIFIPAIFITTSVLILCAAKNLDFYLLVPVFGNGISNIVTQAFFLISTFLEFTLLFLVKPYMKDDASFTKAGNIILTLSFIIITIVTLSYTASFFGDASTEKYPPVFQIIRLINSGTYFQRFDSLFLIAFSLSAYLYLGAMLYFISLIFTNAFKIQKSKATLIPFGFIIVSVSFINILSSFITQSLKTANFFLWTLPVLFPLLLIKKGAQTK